MCLQIKASKLRSDVEALARGKDHNAIFDYLRMTGMVINAKNGMVMVDENYYEKVKFLTSPVVDGDIVWVQGQGMLIVIDSHPAVNNDGHHYRALKVDVLPDGSYQILGDDRSVIVLDTTTFRIKHSTFDIKKIDYLSYERYLAYKRIEEIGNILKDMKEE